MGTFKVSMLKPGDFVLGKAKGVDWSFFEVFKDSKEDELHVVGSDYIGDPIYYPARRLNTDGYCTVVCVVRPNDNEGRSDLLYWLGKVQDEAVEYVELKDVLVNHLPCCTVIYYAGEPSTECTLTVAEIEDKLKQAGLINKASSLKIVKDHNG